MWSGAHLRPHDRRGERLTPKELSCYTPPVLEPAIALQGVTPEELASLLPAVSVEDARRIVSTVHRDGDVSQPSSVVRRPAREAVVARGRVPTLEVVNRAASGLDPFVKLALRTHDGKLIETVRIPLERPGRFSVCVSSQVGCALACAFCATGRLGLGRNLETWEIVEQVRLVRRTLSPERGERVHGIVFQGMGEPLANLENVLGALRVLTDPSARAIDARKITVCTAGLPAGIRRLSREAPRVRLGWSIGTARAGRRRALMPIDGAHPLEEVYAAAVEHAKSTGLSPLWAVTLLAGVNDGEDDARALSALVQRFMSDTGRTPRLSVIPYNRIADDASDPFRRTTDDAERRFRDTLHSAGTFTHKRYSGGSDIGAACGQLAARSL
jgi:23S rRNA (adenine2503-C2)-methyltransferase